MNEKDIIINALCRTIAEKDRYIKQLEDAILYQRVILNEKEKEKNA